MTRDQYTPGPWEWGKDRRWLLRDNLKHSESFSSTTITKIDDDAFRPSEADARLIAAAPDLLEIGQKLLAIFQHPTRHVTIIDQEELEVAIGKALGLTTDQMRAKARGEQ